MAPPKKAKYEVLTSVKGLDPKDPGSTLVAGTVDNPTLVDLADDEETRALVADGALRLWPGPVAEVVPDSERVKQLLAEITELESDLAAAHKARAAALTAAEKAAAGKKTALKPAELKSLGRAADVLDGLAARYRAEAEAATDEGLKATVAADLAEVEADLASVRELLQ